MDLKNVIYIRNGIILSLKKKSVGLKKTCDIMDEPRGHFAKLNKPDTKVQILHDLT